MLFASCASPAPPTGGPVDKTPPSILESEPALNAVNVAADEIRIEFSEYVEPASFRRAFSITPAFEENLEPRWRGRSVRLRFPEPLRPNTTYVLTIDTNLRDIHGVALTAPLTLAFSTGPTISRGTISGRVVDSVTGEGLAGFDVYAYADSARSGAEAPPRPAYRTQTGADGRFSFQYLNEQEAYFVVAVRDRNRNRLPDALEPFAVPPEPAIAADTSAGDGGRWVAAFRDTIPPELQRIRTLSRSRLELRFTEPVFLASRDTAAWVLTDSATATPRRVQAVYTTGTAPTAVYVQTAPLSPGRYFLTPAAVVDSSGNAVPSVRQSFEASTTDDTLSVRFVGFLPAEEGDLAPGRSPGVRFNRPVDEDLLRRAVALTDTAGSALDYRITSPDGTLYLFQPLTGAAVLEIHASRYGGPDTVYTRSFRPLSFRELGEISGVVRAVAEAPQVVVELYRVDAPALPAVRLAGQGGAFRFDSLAAGQYRIRAFADRRPDRRWFPGIIAPYEPAEPVAWSADSLRVRPRFETQLGDTLLIP